MSFKEVSHVEVLLCDVKLASVVAPRDVFQVSFPCHVTRPPLLSFVKDDDCSESPTACPSEFRIQRPISSTDING